MACEYNNIVNNVENMLSKLSANQKERDDVKPLIQWLNEAKVIGSYKENFDKDLDTKLRDTLKKLYPEIKLEYTEDEIQYVDSNGNVMNQEEASNLVKYTLKVVDTLYDIGTPKKSKHGGNSQPVRSTIKLNSKENPNIEVNLTKYLAGKGVSKEQIEYMFEYMKQNEIQEISTLDLAERLLFGLTQNVEIDTAKESDPHVPDDIAIELEKDGLYKRNNSKFYKSLIVPGGTNYKEIEISTPNVKANLKGHAEFATDKGIGWYRVDTEVKGQEAIEMPNSFTDKTNTKWEKEDGVWYLTYPNDVPTKREDLSDAEARRAYYEIDTKINNNTTGTPTKTLRVLEMQSDLFQKMKDKDLSRSTTTQTSLNKAFHQILNTDNKWVRFFIKSIIQNAQRNGYEKIRFPSGETAAKVEGHDTLVDIIRKKEKTLNNIEKAIIKNTEQLEQAKKDSNKYKIDLHTDKLLTLNEEKATLTKELKENNIAKLAPIEDFYQTRVQNTLKKEYGADKIKTVTDEHGNTWFELELDSKRDSQNIMLQKQNGRIKGQANIESGTVLINSLLQSQDTLPHEYAHHYIAWFRDTPIVQEAIKKWGSEEALVQAIGEQVVKQKGEAYGWWKKFTKWLQDIFDSQSDKSKESIKNLLTDSFLTRQNLKETSTYTVYPKAKPDMVKPKDKARPEFDKLPSYKEGQKNMVYAGIGSRETPKDVLDLMTKAAAWLASKGYKLQTGYKRKQTNGKLVEEGADKAFSDGTNNKELFGPDMANATTKSIAEEIHPNLKGMWSAVYNKWVSKVGKEKATEYADGAIDLQARNTFQVFGAKLDTAVDFVLFYAEETNDPMRPKGGTGQAVEMSRRKGIPTINMANKDWRKELTKVIGKKPTEVDQIEEVKEETKAEEGKMTANEIIKAVKECAKG